jgi:hypothetical protein
VEDAVLPPGAAILGVPDRSYDRGKALTMLWPDVLSHSLLKGRSADFAILGLDTLGCFDKR